MKKIYCVFLSIILLFSLFACAGGNEESSPSSTSEINESSLTDESSEQIPEHDPYVIAYTEYYSDSAEILAGKIKEKSDIESILHEIPSDNFPDTVDADIIIGVLPSFKIPYTPLYHNDGGYMSAGDIIYIFGADKDASKNYTLEFADKYITEDGISGDITENMVFNGFPLENSTINGTSLKDFTIVCVDTQNEAKYEDIGKELNAILLAEGNFVIPLSMSKTASYGNEIVIGYSTRRSMLYDSKKEAEYGIGDYRILIKGTKIYIEANNACGAWHAVNRLTELLSEGDVTDNEITGKAELIKVACVGDSITQGNNSADYHKTAYPVYLQRMLGYNFYVKNYGASGYSVVFEDQYSYSKDSRYKDALSLNADVMIFMLGTNDGNPKDGLKDWDGTNREQRYYDNVNEYLDSFLKTNPDMQIFMCLPAPLFPQSTRWGDWEEWAKRIEEHVIPLNRKIAEERNLPIIDIHSWAVEHPEMFPDGLHPLEETYRDYAERVFEEMVGNLRYSEYLPQ